MTPAGFVSHHTPFSLHSTSETKHSQRSHLFCLMHVKMRDVVIDGRVVGATGKLPVVDDIAFFAKHRSLGLYEEEMINSLDHPSIPRCLGQSADGRVLYQHVPGVDLLTRVMHGPKVENPRAVVRKLLSCLAHIHQHGFVHRDVKCENIILTDNDEPYLIDWDECVYLPSMRSVIPGRFDRKLGTFGYLAPEIALSNGRDKVTVRTGEDSCVTCRALQSPALDVWALGCVAYVLEVGRYALPVQEKAFTAFMRGVIARKRMFFLKEHEDMMSPEFKDFVNRVFVLDPQERPSALELLAHPYVEHCC